MNRFHRTLTAAAITALLGSAHGASAASFDRNAFAPIKRDPILRAPIVRDERLQYLSAGESGSGVLNFAADEDLFAVSVGDEGLLRVDMSSANRVSMTLTDSLGRVIGAAGSGYQLIYRVQPGEYRLKVRHIGRSLLSDRSRYSFTTNLTPKPQQTALVVLLENGGVDIGEAAAGEVINMASVIERMLQESPLGWADGAVDNVIDFINPLLPPEQRIVPPDTSIFSDADTLRQLILEATDGYLESGTVDAVYNLAGASYDRIVVLEDGAFNADTVISEISALAPNHQIDIHTLAHGAENELVGFNNERLGRDFFNALGDIDGLYLRSVYQMNCYGGTLMDDWVRVGAGAVNGSQNVNYLPIGYFAFLQQWSDGTPFAQAVQIGYDTSAPVGHVLYEMVDLHNDEGEFLVDWTGFTDPRIVPDEELQESVMTVTGSTRNVDIDD